MNRLSFPCSGPAALVIFAALSLGAAACTNDVAIDGGGGSGGSAQTSTATGATTGMDDTTTGGMTTGSATTGGGGGGDAETSIAVFDMTIPQVPATTQNGWLTDGEKLDPQTLLVIVGTRPQACNAPDFDLGPENFHQVLIGLPKALQAVGKYDISSTDVIGSVSSWLTDGMGNGGGGGGPLLEGTVEVLSIDTGTIKVRLEGLVEEFTDLNGDHVVAICPSGV